MDEATATTSENHHRSARRRRLGSQQCPRPSLASNRAQKIDSAISRKIRSPCATNSQRSKLSKISVSGKKVSINHQPTGQSRVLSVPKRRYVRRSYPNWPSKAVRKPSKPSEGCHNPYPSPTKLISQSPAHLVATVQSSTCSLSRMSVSKPRRSVKQNGVNRVCDRRQTSTSVSQSLKNRNYRRSTSRARKRPANVSAAVSVESEARDSYEAFLLQFAIPTHLYRYLALRHQQKPLYLNRTLSYLGGLSSCKITSTRGHRTTKRPSLDQIVERLRTASLSASYLNGSKFSPQLLNNSLSYGTNGVDYNASRLPTLSLSHPLPQQQKSWPDEVQLCFEGFFDSEKEFDWVTVEASVGLYFRFGWAWRHKPALADTLYNPFGNPFPLTCHNQVIGLDFPISGGDSYSSQIHGGTCTFSPTDIINQVKWISTGSRLHSGQLELRIQATERRWLKRPDLSRFGSEVNPTNNKSKHLMLNNGETIKLTGNTSSAKRNRKGGFAQAAYPVHYTTAPLPLFYPAHFSNAHVDPYPFLLTPGLYELRLGVDHGDCMPSDRVAVPLNDSISKPTNGSLPNGHTYHLETVSTTGSATSTSDFPTTLPSSVTDDAISNSMMEAGATTGRVEWRRIRFPTNSENLDEYSRWPRLRFRVVWKNKEPVHYIGAMGNQAVNGLERIKPELLNGFKEHRGSPRRMETARLSAKAHAAAENPSLRRLSQSSQTFPLTSPDDPSVNLQTDGLQSSESIPSVNNTRLSSLILPRPITYRFVYRGSLQQWSESTDLVCPWCHLDCSRARERGPETLLVHLRTCHPRFRFKATWSSNRSHLSLEVSLNDNYDGSNDCGLRRWHCGLDNGRRTVTPGQLVGGWAGLGVCAGDMSDSRQKSMTCLTLSGRESRFSVPVRRLPYTHLIFWRGAERAFEQPVDPTLSVHPMAIGHNRVYYHTRSAQPIRTCEFHLDSESEDAPEWLQQHYQRKVEEFTDVNQGEKQIMQMWNALLLPIGPSELVVCDSQVANLAAYFVHQFAPHIHRRRLRRNLILHFVNLTDYGLLSTGQLRQLIATYDRLVPKDLVTVTPSAF